MWKPGNSSYCLQQTPKLKQKTWCLGIRFMKLLPRVKFYSVMAFPFSFTFFWSALKTVNLLLLDRMSVYDWKLPLLDCSLNKKAWGKGNDQGLSAKSKKGQLIAFLLMNIKEKWSELRKEYLGFIKVWMWIFFRALKSENLMKARSFLAILLYTSKWRRSPVNGCVPLTPFLVHGKSLSNDSGTDNSTMLFVFFLEKV